MAHDDDMAMDDGGADHSHDHSHGAGHAVPEDMAVPQVAIDVVPDAVRGVNLSVDLADFAIAPERASTESRNGEGHMHLYVDGERVMRFYNQDVHLNLPPGERTVMVELSANDHQPWTVDGEAITASQTVTVPEPSGNHAHGAEGVALPALPLLGMNVVPDPKSGWNVDVTIDWLDISAAAVNTDPVDGQGHMHLYVNDQKVTRLYGTWWHLKELPAGRNEIRVTVNGNDHAPLMFNDEPVAVSAFIEVPEDGTAGDTAMDEMAMSEGKENGELDTDSALPIVGEYINGEVIMSEDRFDVARGDLVTIIMTSDVAEEVHVHGFDLHLDLTPGEEARLEFVADIPGLFEVELEESHRFLFELAVS